VKTVVGWLIVVGHLSIAAAVLFARDDVFDFSQKIGVLLVLGPVFSVYFVSVVRRFIVDAQQRRIGEKVNANFVGICLLLPSVQLLFVHYLIYYYPSTISGDIDSLQRWISGMEVFLGGTVGLVVDDLFPRQTDVKG
jgi:hypothetical protein